MNDNDLPNDNTGVPGSAGTVVLGAGLGGLAAAALLADAGDDVVVLEAHSTTGGCAGCFDRYDRAADGTPRRFRFDVGATTLSAMGPREPLGRLYAALGSAPHAVRLNPGMLYHASGGVIVRRHVDEEEWIAECCARFGERGQRGFWREVFLVNALGWELTAANPAFPPKSLRDLFRMITFANLRNLPLLGRIRRSVLQAMDHHGLEGNAAFAAFINEALMITAQARAADVPFPVGAMGLAYPGDTWYPFGGMYAVAEHLERCIVARGGRVLTKRRVTALARDGDAWLLRTSRGESHRAPRVVANATIFDMPELLGGRGERYFSRISRSAGPLWGAFTLYCAVRDEFDDRGALYHQIAVHGDELEGAGSAFVSISHPADRGRAPEGWRTITVSTHVAAPERFAAMSRAEYHAWKDRLTAATLALVGRALPGFRRAERKFLLAGTPRTFAHYTGRRHGTVGGIPHNISRNMLFMPKHRTPLKGLYLVGDTVYPGQGAPGVVLGALNLAAELVGRS